MGKMAVGAGPVTLVIRRDSSARALSWVFPHELEAWTVVRALRNSTVWMLIRGAFSSADEALRAADQGLVLCSACAPAM